MTSTFIEPFNLKKIFVDFFIGDANLFALLFIIIYSYAAGKFGFPNSLYFFFLVIGVILFSAFVGFQIYVIVMLLLGGFAFKAIGDYFK